MNRPNFFPSPKERKKQKNGPFQLDDIGSNFIFLFFIFWCVLWYMIVSGRDGESLLFEAYPKLAQEPKYVCVHTYITRAVFQIRLFQTQILY